MSDRYFAKVVMVKDSYSIVINKGANNGVKLGDKFLVVGLGAFITDPETNEILEQLEIVKGKVEVKHVQEKISTLDSCDYTKASDAREIKKTSSNPLTNSLFGLGTQNTVTEVITPGESKLKYLNDVKSGDLLIKI